MFSDKRRKKNAAIKELDEYKRTKQDENYKEINIYEENTIKTEYIGCNSDNTDEHRSNKSNIKNEELYISYNKINNNFNIETKEIRNEEVFVYVTEVAIEHEATNCNEEQIKSEVLDISYEKEINSNIDSSDEETLIKYLGNKASNVNKDQYKCDKCDFVANTKNTLRRHTYYSHSRGNLKCPYCPYKTLYTTSIQRHINAKHTQSNIFQCPLCNYETFTESNLNRHINGKHTKVTSFNCPHCCYKTYYKSALLKHINYKHNKHLLNCLYCKYETCLKSNLNRHIKAKHPETI